jgi:hypothetical protein
LSASERLLAVRSGCYEPEKKCRNPDKTTGSSCKSLHAGGGTRTPDTRIMIPLL